MSAATAADPRATLTPRSAEALIDAEVREVIRRDGIDPVADPGAVRVVIADAVTTYERQRLTNRLPALDEVDRIGRRLFDSVAGLGPLQRYLDDPDVEEIWINSRFWFRPVV